MEKITKLTAEQEAKLPVYRDMYLDKFFNNPHVTTQEECEEYFEFFYKEFTDVKEKPTVDVIPQKPQDSEFECFGCSS